MLKFYHSDIVTILADSIQLRLACINAAMLFSRRHATHATNCAFHPIACEELLPAVWHDGMSMVTLHR